jgi:ribonuclease-3
MNIEPYNPFNYKNKILTKRQVEKIVSVAVEGFKVHDINPYQTAMVHSSYVKRQEYTLPTGETTQLAVCPLGVLPLFDESYQRLEHLGDSVLSVVVSSYLFKRFPSENEGFMTDLKKEIVCNEMLGFLSLKLGLEKYYIISRHNEDICGGRENRKKLSDILEAFIGALWIETGYNYNVVNLFIIYLIENYIDIPRILRNNRNFKEQIQKIYQAKYHYTPTYTMTGVSDGIYTMTVCDKDGLVLGTGTGTTKKQAEQLAAKDALSRKTEIL